MTSHFPSPLVLTSTNWNDEWKKLQLTRKEPSDASYWDKRAATFHTSDAPSAYVEQFLSLADLSPRETVLDMGCGNGALALPLAKAGHKVIACDFSCGMLDDLKTRLRKQNVSNVDVKQLSWEDDWKVAGIPEKCVDVAIASRSIATADLEAALRKLNNVARKRVCVTLATGPSPHTDATVLKALGLPVANGYDYLYAYLILAQMGYLPEIRHITSYRSTSYNTTQDALASVSDMVRQAESSLVHEQKLEAALEHLPQWLEENLIENENAGCDDGHGKVEGPLRLKAPRKITWAFLSWSTENTPRPAW